MLNCFKYFLIYILQQNVTKWERKNYIKSKCPNTPILYTLKELLSKNWFCIFFLIFWHKKIPSSFRMPRYHLSFSWVFCVFQISYTMYSIRIVSGSSSSKLLSRLILLKSILRIPISLQANTTLPESSLK